MRISWETYEQCVNTLVEKIREDGFMPEVIVAIGVSGFVPAALVAKRLGLNQIETIIIASYTDRKKSAPKIISTHVTDALEDKRVLVVDDIVATGETFAIADAHIRTRKPRDVKYAAPVVSEFVCKKYPDYWGQSILRAPDDFITFPWDN